jgi:ParB family chromosome partitioning protein
MMTKKSPLGRGLGALITDAKYEVKNVEEAISTGSIAEIDISKIETNPFQPRAHFDEDALKELAESIEQLGIIQPITVRKIKEDLFQLISGERRFRASKMAGLNKIPAFVRKANDQEMLEFALVENIQREDLNPVEIAITYKRLLEECSLTQEQLSDRTGKGRSSVSNYLRLLNLPPEIQAGLRSKDISMGHAKALSGLKDKQEQVKLFYKVLAGSLSVRVTEEIVKEELEADNTEKTEKKVKKSDLPEKFNYFKNGLSKKLSAKIDLKRDEKGQGKIVINFKSDEEFERLSNLLKNLE